MRPEDALRPGGEPRPSGGSGSKPAVTEALLWLLNRFEKPLPEAYLSVAARRNSESNLCLAQAPKPKSAARPRPSHKPTKNRQVGCQVGSGRPPVQIRETTSATSAKATFGKARTHPTVPLTARLGFFAVRPCHRPTQYSAVKSATSITMPPPQRQSQKGFSSSIVPVSQHMKM